MAKYCIHCGKELKNNEKCECNINLMESDFALKITSLLKGIFVMPLDTIKANAKKDNFSFSMILMLVFSVFMGFFVSGLIKAYYGSVELISSYYRYMENSVGISYFDIFIKVTFITFVLSFVFAGVRYLVNTVIFKGISDYKKIYSLYGVVSLINSCALLVGIVLLFINVYLALALVFASFILSMSYMYSSLKLLGVKDENKYGYIHLATCILNLIMLITFVNFII